MYKPITLVAKTIAITLLYEFPWTIVQVWRVYAIANTTWGSTITSVSIDALSCYKLIRVYKGNWNAAVTKRWAIIERVLQMFSTTPFTRFQKDKHNTLWYPTSNSINRRYAVWLLLQQMIGLRRTFRLLCRRRLRSSHGFENRSPNVNTR